MQFIKIRNRTNKTLQGTWDARQYDIPPGESEWPREMALKFKLQNPIMGTADPYSGTAQYKIGIEAWGDDVSPLDESIKESDELIDRSKLPEHRQHVERFQREGLFADFRSPLSPTAGTIDITHVR